LYGNGNPASHHAAPEKNKSADYDFGVAIDGDDTVAEDNAGAAHDEDGADLT